MARSLRALVELFVAHRKRMGIAPQTLRAYRFSLDRLIAALEGAGIETLEEVTPEVLYQYQSALITAPGRAGRRLAVGTQCNAVSRMRSFFQFLVKQGYTLIDPTRLLERPRYVHHPPHDVPTLSALKQLFDIPNTRTPIGIRDRAMLELLYSTGIRVGELVRLDVYDIDLGEGELTVRAGKGGKSRRVPVGDAACQWVRRYLDQARPQCLKRRSQPALFVSYRGHRLNGIVVAWLLRELCRAGGVKPAITPHRLRHAFATHMLRNRASVRHIQEMLGHERLDTTQIYTKVDITDLKEVHRRCHPRGRR